jgi:alkylated DNA repair dioxygenase AlkB
MEKELINLTDATLEYYPEFLEMNEANRIYDLLLNSPAWKHEKIKLFGKEIFQPRLTALFGEKSKTYSYSGLEMKPKAFPKDLLDLKERCEAYCDEVFNICLANLYRDGSDSMGWHADNEKELGPQPVIASVSLGDERIFHLKHNSKDEKYKKRLQHGSLLIMKGSTQEYWKHQLPKTRKKVEPRINLTFRKVY